jgi:hypothetical protein
MIAYLGHQGTSAGKLLTEVVKRVERHELATQSRRPGGVYPLRIHLFLPRRVCRGLLSPSSSR